MVPGRWLLFLTLSALIGGFGSLLDQALGYSYQPIWKSVDPTWGLPFYAAACLSYALSAASLLLRVARPEMTRVATWLWALSVLTAVLSLCAYVAGRRSTFAADYGFVAVLVFYLPGLLGFANLMSVWRTRRMERAGRRLTDVRPVP